MYCCIREREWPNWQTILLYVASKCSDANKMAYLLIAGQGAKSKTEVPMGLILAVCTPLCEMLYTEFAIQNSAPFALIQR